MPQPDTAADPAPSTPKSNPLATLVAGFRRPLWFFFLLSLLAHAYAWFWPDDLTPRQGLALTLAYARFMLRTFWMHAGLAWLALAILAALLSLVTHRASFRRLTLASLAIATVALGPTALRFTRPPPPTPESLQTNRTDDLRVLTANLLLWNRLPLLVKAQIDRFQPDVILFQEYTPGMAELLRPLLAAEYPYIEESPQRDSFGQAVYSKLPFVTPPEIYPQIDYLISQGLEPRAAGLIGSGDPQIRIVIKPAPNAPEVVIQNVHLSTPYRMDTYNEQRSMARWLADWVSTERRPLIIAGDFNNTPHSAEAGLLRDAGLVETHESVGRGPGTTWPKPNYWRHAPGIRLDQIWTRGLEPTWSGTGTSMCSDHHASEAGLTIPASR